MDPNVFETANAGFAQVMYEEFLRNPAGVDPASGFGRVDAWRDGHQLVGGQADELSIATADAKRPCRAGNCLPRPKGRHSLAQFIYDSDDVLA